MRKESLKNVYLHVGKSCHFVIEYLNNTPSSRKHLCNFTLFVFKITLVYWIQILFLSLLNLQTVSLQLLNINVTYGLP